MPQNWLFLVSYKKLRQKLLRNETWRLIARLGPGAFQTPMWDFNVQLLTINRGRAGMGEEGIFARPGEGEHLLRMIDVSRYRDVGEKATKLLDGEIHESAQRKQLKNPDARILLDILGVSKLLGNYAKVPQGIKTGDDNRFRLKFWELDTLTGLWKKYHSTPDSETHKKYSGMFNILWWEDDGNHLARRQGEHAWGKKGIAIGQMNKLPWSYYCGNIQDSNINAIIPTKERYILPVISYVTSDEFRTAVRRIDKKISVTNSSCEKVPFDQHWQRVAAESSHGLPKPYSDDPTQWLFHGHPAAASSSTKRPGCWNKASAYR